MAKRKREKMKAKALRHARKEADRSGIEAAAAASPSNSAKGANPAGLDLTAPGSSLGHLTAASPEWKKFYAAVMQEFR